MRPEGSHYLAGGPKSQKVRAVVSEFLDFLDFLVFLGCWGILGDLFFECLELLESLVFLDFLIGCQSRKVRKSSRQAWDR